MKKEFLFFIVMSLAALASCAKKGHMSLKPTTQVSSENPPQVDTGNQPGPAYDPDILRIVNKNCVQCHGVIPTIPDWRHYDVVKSKLHELKERVIEKRNMPLGGRLSDQDFQIFKKWLDNGAPEKATGPATTTIVSNNPPASAQPTNATPVPAKKVLISCQKKDSQQNMTSTFTFDENQNMQAIVTTGDKTISTIEFFKSGGSNSATICNTVVTDLNKCSIEKAPAELAIPITLNIKCDTNLKAQLSMALQNNTLHISCNAGGVAIVADYEECMRFSEK